MSPSLRAAPSPCSDLFVLPRIFAKLNHGMEKLRQKFETHASIFMSSNAIQVVIADSNCMLYLVKYKHPKIAFYLRFTIVCH